MQIVLISADSISFLAEVLDKEPGAWAIAGPALCIAGVVFALSVWRWWLGPLIFPALLILGWAVTSELRDPAIGRAIWLESPLYFVVIAGAVAALVLAPLAGSYVAAVRGRRTHLRR